MVLDEADLLLSGGFERDVGRLLDGMKQNDKERKAQCLSQELGILVEDFQALPRHVKAAAYEGNEHQHHDVTAMLSCKSSAMIFTDLLGVSQPALNSHMHFFGWDSNLPTLQRPGLCRGYESLLNWVMSAAAFQPLLLLLFAHLRRKDLSHHCALQCNPVQCLQNCTCQSCPAWLLPYFRLAAATIMHMTLAVCSRWGSSNAGRGV